MLGVALLVCIATSAIAYKLRQRSRRRLRSQWREYLSGLRRQ